MKSIFSKTKTISPDDFQDYKDRQHIIERIELCEKGIISHEELLKFIKIYMKRKQEIYEEKYEK